MKTTRMSSRDSALFAVLMREEFDRRKLIFFPDGGLMGQWAYLDFLRSQSKRGYAGCAYRLAISMIEARA